ncbi:hypothetical protein [Listeria seeligeri]|uniref:hypothetical protein n=1 Tax=Listeria seeligeri TaxID=1640 RepID=UPI0022EAD31D|nr:hypothetical protein [Listeria seeligeri]
MNLEVGTRSKVFPNLSKEKNGTCTGEIRRKGMFYTHDFSKDYHPKQLVVMDTLSEIKKQRRNG